MKKIILHVGAPKTGSTFLQRHFCENQSILRSEGVYYPLDPVVSKIAANAKLLATLLEGKPTQRFIRSFPELDTSNLTPSSAYSALVKDWDENSETLVLSAENFNNSHAESMRALVREDIEVTVILFIRQQDKWIQSYFNQLAKSGLIKSSIEKIVDSVLDQNNQEFYRPDWYQHYSSWKQHFEDCRVVFFEDAKTDLLKSFYDVADLRLPTSASSIAKKQVSINNYQLAYLMEIAQDSKIHEFNRCRTISADVNVEAEDNKNISFLSPSIIDKIQSTFHESNSLLMSELKVTRSGYTEYEPGDIEYIAMNRFVQSEEYLAYKFECEKRRLGQVA